MIGAFFNQTAEIYPYMGEAEGEQVYGECDERPCRLQHGAKSATTYKNPAGQIWQDGGNTIMYCQGSQIPTQSRVVCDEREYFVKECREKRGMKKAHHLEVLLE